MKLFLDTSNSERISIKIDKKEFSSESKMVKAQALLPLIVDSLAKESKDIQDIKEIEVNTGPGSFTGLRVGIAVANALGWALNVPVNGKDISLNQFIEINYTSNK